MRIRLTRLAVWMRVLRRLTWSQIRLPHVSEKELFTLQESLLQESTISPGYLILTMGSCVIATLGLLADSVAVIIGAMIIAPLMLPIRGIALGALEGNVRLFKAAAYSILLGTGLGISVSCLLGWLVNLAEWGDQILSRTRPNLLDLGIALAAGTIAGYARVRPQISDSLAGVAIAVALMPPVCVIGLGLSQGDWQATGGASQLYLTNLLGIALACMLTFMFTGYTPILKAQSALLSTLGLIGLLIVPLGANLTRLLTQAQLEDSLRIALQERTITFQRVQVQRTSFNWGTEPPEVRFFVQTEEPITPRQVQLLERFADSAVGRPFKLIFEVAQTQTVTSEGSEPPTSLITPPSPSPSPSPATASESPTPNPSPEQQPSPPTSPLPPPSSPLPRL